VCTLSARRRLAAVGHANLSRPAGLRTLIVTVGFVPIRDGAVRSGSAGVRASGLIWVAATGSELGIHPAEMIARKLPSHLQRLVMQVPDALILHRQAL